MSFKLVKSILGSSWMVRESDAMLMATYFESFLNGDHTSLQEFAVVDKTRFIQSSGFYQDSMDDESVMDTPGVVVFPISGMIMKDDYCGDMGTKSMVAKMKQFDEDPNVGAVVIDFDTPGGQGQYALNFWQQVYAMRETTPVLAYYSSQLCSGGYYFASACLKIYASTEIDQVGSIGTLVQLLGPNEKCTHQMPYVIHTIYATKSPDKHKPYNEAVSAKRNYDLIRTTEIDPFNEVFHQSVRTGRPDISEKALTGSVVFSEEAISLNMIDGIKSLDEVIHEAFQLISNQDDMKFKNPFKSNTQKTMTKFENLSAILGREVNADSTFSAEDMEKIEAHKASELSAKGADVDVEQNNSAELVQTIQSTIEASLAPVNETLTSLGNRLSILEKKPAADPTVLAPKGAPSATAGKTWTSSDDPLNQEAERALGM